jgi:YD repeat-containing protein
VDASFTKTAKVVDYTYDDLNRLTQASTTPDIASGASNAGRNMTERWTYDALGNILTDATSTLNGTFATTTYTYLFVNGHADR